jgi:hypothetical protein
MRMARSLLAVISVLWHCSRSSAEVFRDHEEAHKQAIEMSLSGDYDGALSMLRFYPFFAIDFDSKTAQSPSRLQQHPI